MNAGHHRYSWLLLTAFVSVAIMFWPAAPSQGEAAALSQAASSAATILELAGVKGGLVVQLGCGDGQLTAALHASDAYLVHGLDPDPDNVAAARKHIQSLGLYGPVSVDRLSSKHLPYVDNLVNLLVVEQPGLVSESELQRVLAPGAVLCIREGGRWVKRVKRRPANIAEWTHYLHDSTNNAVSADEVVGPPRRLQWIGSPRYTRHHDHMSSFTAAVTAGGRLFYILDEGSPASILLPPHWKLIARDAYSGVVLWKRSIAQWHPHLWPLKSGPASLPRRLVADGQRVYVTLGIDSPVTALDAASGQTVLTYKGTKGTEEILLSEGTLFLVVNEHPEHWFANNIGEYRRAYDRRFWDERPRQVMAIDADSGRVLWSIESPVMPLTLAADTGRVVFHDGARVVAVDRWTGKRFWLSEPLPRAREIRSFFAPALVIYKDVVLFAGGETAGLQTGSWYEKGPDTITALDADTGRKLWSAYHPPSGYRSSEDVLVVNGLLWLGETLSGRVAGLFKGLEPRSGQVKVQFTPDVKTYWFHHRCYRAKATCRYLLTARTGTEFIDVRSGHWEPHHWVRGACLYGVLPANGLLYVPPHPCACYLESKLFGLNALAPAQGTARVPTELATAGRLETGPAYGKVKPEPLGADDWPTYRHDAARSGCSASQLPARLKTLWEKKLGGKLTSPVVAAGRLYVAASESHTLYALAADSGQLLWQFTAGGRIDSPPTLYAGLAIFGSADGYVYALRASDGQLAWRFRAAPVDERLVAFEQLESVWPVHGSVLVRDGLLYFVAGRSMFLDGGLHLYRLEPSTGKLLSETVLDDIDRRTGKRLLEYVSWLNMPAALPDVLSSDDRYVYMRSQAFLPDGTRLPLERMPRRPDADQGAPDPLQVQKWALAHLFSPTGLLDDTYWHRTYWMYGSTFVSGWCGYYLAGQVAPAGRILSFDKETVYGFGRKPRYYRWTTPIEYQLFAAAKPRPGRPQQPEQASLLAVDKSPSLNVAGKPVTVMAWVKPSRADGVIVARGGSVRGFALYLADSRPVFAVREGGEIVRAQGKEPVAGDWVHLAGVAEQGRIGLYVDGKLAANSRLPSLLSADPYEALEMGTDADSAVADYRGPVNFAGVIDEVRLYRRALSQREIAEAAAEPKPEPEAELVLCLDFNAGMALDSSGKNQQLGAKALQPAEGKYGKGLKFSSSPRLKGIYVQYKWFKDVPIIVRAMVLAGRTLFVAGPPDLVDENVAAMRLAEPETQKLLARQEEALAGKYGANLIAFDAESGEKLAELKLSAPPRFDGLIAAAGRLYLVTADGTVIAMSGSE